MKALRLAGVVLWLVIACGPPPRARAEAAWSQYGVRDGLLSRTVHCIQPTQAGGLLVGTSGGLNQWDGMRWRQYSAGNGLAAGPVTAVAETAGAIWAGSWGGGLSVLRSDAWQTYRAADSPLPSDWISGLASDGATLWIATYGGGLARWQRGATAAGAWTVYRRADSDIPSDSLTCILPDGARGLWVGSELAGLAHLTAAGSWESIALPQTGDVGMPTVTALAWRAGTPRELWVGTRDGAVRLAEDAQGVWRALPADPTLSGASVTCLAAEADGRMWVGTKDGLLGWQAGRATRNTVRDGLPHAYVSALALDSAGRLWAGTLTAGLALRGEALPSTTIKRLPVVLVHGWRSAASDRLEDSEFWNLAGWLREDGFPAYFATGISPAQTLHQNASALLATIDRALRETGASQVYLIAFSMGGLNARAYLESTLYRGDVARVFILGTPHQGEDLWFSFLLWEQVSWSSEPSTLELFPAHMALFNATHAQPRDVPYVLVAGDATLKMSNLAASRLPTLFGEMTPSDGLVSTWSALGPSSLAGERRLTIDIHAWAQETQLLDLPSLLLPRATYDAHIRPFLFGVGDAAGAGSPVEPSSAYAPANAPRSALRTGRVTPGQSVTLATLQADSSGRMRVYLRWDGYPLDMTLRDPAGLLRTAQAPGPNAEYLELGFADFAGYVITDTLPGAWEVMLSSPQTSVAPSRYVVYAEWPDSDVQLEAVATPWVDPGVAATITATVRGPADLTVDEVYAELFTPYGHYTSVLQPAIPARGQDGLVFTGTAEMPMPGYYSLLVTARGTVGEQAFERGAYANLGVRSDGAKLLNDAALHTTALPDGRTGLVADIGVEVRTEGDYMLSALLVRADTRASVRVAHPLHLQPGVERVPVAFDALPYTPGVTYWLEVALLDISGAALPVDAITNAALLPATP